MPERCLGGTRVGVIALLPPRRLVAALAVCLGLTAACSAAQDGAETDGAETSSPSPTADPGDTGSGDGGTSSAGPEQDPATPGTPSLNDEQLAEQLAGLGGRLAVGNGPQLSVVRPDGAAELVLDGSETVVAVQPTWSRDGSALAWGSLSADKHSILVQEFGDDGLPDERGPDVADASGMPVFYLQWSRADDRLAYLRNAPVGVSVEVGLVEPGSPVEPLAQGAPFYIAWSPFADRLLAHVGDVTIDAFDTGRPELGFQTVTPQGGGFSAPAWVDATRALVVVDGALSLLDVDAGTLEAIEPVGGTVSFVLSPDRTRVAYRRIGSGGDLTLAGWSPEGHDRAISTQGAGEGLVVLDLETGERQTVTGEQALAWEWSPDGSRLAWLSARVARLPLGRWHFWSVDGTAPATDRTPEFALTRKYGQAYLPFFAQYAQSVTGWSPDSSAYAFAGGVGGLGGVWVQLLDESVEAQRVSAGDFVTWGPGTPLPVSGADPSAA